MPVEIQPEAPGANPSAKQGTNATVLRDRGSFEALSEEWNELFEFSSFDNPFLSFDWMHEWWLDFGRGELFLVTLRLSSGQLVGIAPFYIDSGGGKLGFLANQWVGSDHLDLLAMPGWEQAVALETATVLKQHRREWSFIELSDIDEDSLASGLLRTALADAGLKERVMRVGNCPFVKLPGSFDDYLAMLNPQWRRNFRHSLRQLSRAGTVHLVPVDHAPAIFDRYNETVLLHRMRFASSGKSSAILDDRIQAFHQSVLQRMTNRGWARLYILEVDRKPIAGCYGFALGRRFLALQMGFDPAWARYSAGGVAMGLVIKDCIEQGRTEFDFLRGEERYKFHWTRTMQRVQTVRLFDWSPSGHIRYAASCLSARWAEVRHFLRAAIDRRPLVRQLLQRARLLPSSGA